jgi:hypothetical protein
MRLRLPYRGLSSLALFAALCGTLAHWSLQILTPAAPVAPAILAPSASGPIDTSVMSRLFGTAPATTTPAAASAPVNVRILGILAPESRRGTDSGTSTSPAPRARPNQANQGVALISIDGQAAKPYAVGDTLPNGLRVQAIRRDAVELLDQGRILSAPTPATSDLGILTRGPTAASGPATGSSASRPPQNGPAFSPPASPAPMPSAPTSPPAAPAEPGAPAVNQGVEAPMPPPPPVPASGAVPGPALMPLR